MKNLLATLLLCFALMSLISAKPIDENIWKEQKSLDSAYIKFKLSLKTYDGYYFMREPQINAFYKALKDTTTRLKSVIATNETNIASLTGTVTTLNSTVEDLQNQLKESQANVASIDVMGGSMDKGGFSTLMFTLLFIILAVAVIGYLLFMRSNRVTSNTQRTLNDLQDEYEKHRQKSVEREMKLNRQLQTERNKMEELKSKGAF